MEVDQPRKKAVAYVRISSLRQIDNESPETQKDKIQQYADAQNIDILTNGWFFDEAKSGKNADRQELQNLLRFALQHKGQIDYVIVYRMNRASRDLDSYVSQVRLVLQARGITVRSATEPVDETKMGRFMENLFVLLGQLDNDGKAETTIDNMTALALQGYWQHPPVLGYDSQKIPNERGKPRPSMKPNQMAVKVKDVLERFSVGNITKAEITRYAAGIGLRSINGKIIGEDSMNRLLNSPEHAGFVHDKFTGYELVKGQHEGIISNATYQRNQELMKTSLKKGEIHLKKNDKYPLKGTALCMHCRNPLYASAPTTGSGGKSPRYHCARNSCKGKAASMGADKVHADFAEVLKKIKPTDGILKLYKTVLIREANDQLANLNKQIAKARDELDSTAELRANTIKKFIEDAITLDEKGSLVDSLDERKVNLSLELMELEQQQNIREADIEYAVNFMHSVDKQWEDVAYDLKQRFQRMIFPEGLIYDPLSRRFGTNNISPLYRYIPTKKASGEASKLDMVAGAGIAPATSWL